MDEEYECAMGCSSRVCVMSVEVVHFARLYMRATERVNNMILLHILRIHYYICKLLEARIVPLTKDI